MYGCCYDEPFNGLDPLTRVTVGTKLFARFREQSTIVFFVTHNLDDIVKYAGRCLVFSGTRIVETTPNNEKEILAAIQ